MGDKAREVEITDLSVGPVLCWPPVPPQLLPELCRDFSISDGIKNMDAGDLVTLVGTHLIDKWAGLIQIYTDAPRI